MKQIDISSLEISPVDTTSPIPLYFQVEDDLRQLIQTGQLRPTELLPPELDLCRLYGVGRHTIRTALSRLADDNLIVRKAGLGTYIANQNERRHFYLNRSFTHQITEMGMVPRSEVLEVTQGTIDQLSPPQFGRKIGLPCLRLARLRFGDDIPISLQRTTVLTEFCPGLEQFDFSKESLYSILMNEFNLVIERISHTVNAVASSEEQAAHLRVAEGTPLLLVKSTCYMSQGEIVEHTVSYYRTDRYEYQTVLEYEP